MKIVKQSFAFFLVFVMLVCACPIAVSAEGSNGEITVGNASGYPGDIVGVKIRMDSLPSNGFAFGTFVVTFGEGLEYVNAVQASTISKSDLHGITEELHYGELVTSNPYDVMSGENRTIRLFYNNGTSPNFKYTADMVTIYFRIKGNVNASVIPITIKDEGDIFARNDPSDVKVCFDYVGGTVTVLERETELGETLKGHSLTLEGNISLNFHIELGDKLSNDPDATVDFTIAAKDGDITYSEKLLTFKNDDGVSTIFCSLPATMWASDVTMQIVGGDGSKGSAFTYSVKNYALYMLSGCYTTMNSENDEKLKDLCVALLNYGSFAQTYFDYNINSLANQKVYTKSSRLPISDLVSVSNDESIKAYNSDVLTKPSLDKTDGSGLTYLGADVALDSATAIRHSFSVEGDLANYKFFVSMDGENYSEVAPAVSGGEVSVTISNISAADLDTPYFVKVSNSGDTALLTVKYSVRNYMSSVLNNGSLGSDIKNAMRAMYLYSEAANAYFGK